MRIALDAMGGDDAPQVNVDGVIEALKAHPNMEVFLVGDQDALEPLLNKAGYSGERLHVVPSEGFVGMEEKPADALRKKPGCSIAVCWRLLAEKKVDAVVSAGNTGGVVAFGLRTRLFLKGIKRPGIAVVLPTSKGPCLLMDVGANPGARPEHLVQYAVMGGVFAQEVLGIETPRVGLMNIGSEDGKGTDLVRETHQLLLGSAMSSSYIGNVEGRGLYHGEADVVICEGFVGNVVLKVSEGMASMMMQTLAREVCGALEEAQRPKAAAAFGAAAKKFEYNEVGGAPLLGIDGICMIAHGSSDARSIRNALRTALELHERQVNSKIVEQWMALEEAAADS
ncbi:MAG: phosphate acyltransferase PlsX [Planctomycetaceae bacterium]|nr:phosphate acyltransferase PlsX [Planctomycetaceae bacterium]MCB9950319.1 phosphate acyltransferase PlsX [Planctomycetaceae bacterium]